MRSMSTTRAGQAVSATLRRAGLDDAGAVADVLIRSRHASVGSIPGAVHSDDEVREWIKDVVIPEREVWLAESDGGQVLATLVLDGGWIDNRSIRFSLLDESGTADTIAFIQRVIELPQ